MTIRKPGFTHAYDDLGKEKEYNGESPLDGNGRLKLGQYGIVTLDEDVYDRCLLVQISQQSCSSHELNCASKLLSQLSTYLEIRNG